MLCCQSNEVINFKDNAHHHSVSGLFLFVFVTVFMFTLITDHSSEALHRDYEH